MSAEFHKWIVDKGYATLTSDVQLMLWNAWVAGGLDALCKDLTNYSSPKNLFNSGTCDPLLQKADHLARTICKVMRDYTTTVDRKHVLALANDWLDEFHSEKSNTNP
jgi:hypothetical protein